MTDDDRDERRILCLFVAAFAISAGIATGVLGLTAWVIIRVTLHFT